jgi:hypothetical protein
MQKELQWISDNEAVIIKMKGRYQFIMDRASEYPELKQDKDK